MEAFLRRRGIPFRTDETNLDRRILRNRIRLETLPTFARVDPAVVRHLGRLSELARDEEELLGKVTATAWLELSRPDGDFFSLDAVALGGLPRALARRVVRMYLSELLGGLRGVSFDDVEDILALKEGKETAAREKARLPAGERPHLPEAPRGAPPSRKPSRSAGTGKGSSSFPDSRGSSGLRPSSARKENCLPMTTGPGRF